MHMRVLAFFLALALPAFADNDECWNADRSFYDCDQSGGGAVGASAPLIGETIGANPASLPVAPTPFGIEGILSDRGSPNGGRKADISTVKGFEGIGFGVGTWIDSTFGAPDFPEHFLSSSAYAEFQRYSLDPPVVPGIRLGGTVLLPRGPMPKGIRFSLGASGGLGRIRGDWSPQIGILARIYRLGVGYSESFERLSTNLPATRISHLSAGLPLGPLYFGYTYSTIRSAVNFTYSNLFLMRITVGPWVAHGGLKVQKDPRGLPEAWHRAGIQRRLGKMLGAGYEYGLYRYSHSAAVQLYF